jgi:hypothetical protein
MDVDLLSTKFARMGARLKIAERIPRRLVLNGAVALDVREDAKGEFFEIIERPGSDVEIDVLDVQPSDRHLLLLVREDGEKSKFLCGHDERHWFVAGIPEKAPVGTVKQAKHALKPSVVRAVEAKSGLNADKRDRRKNAAFIRQGEWFFIPADDIAIDDRFVLRHEPLRRGGGKPHWVDQCYRTGGETVYVCGRHPNGVIEIDYKRILSANPKAKNWGWTTMRRNPGVFVKGRVRHADHATIRLQGWHRVVMNTESESKAMRNVAFLD